MKKEIAYFCTTAAQAAITNCNCSAPHGCVSDGKESIFGAPSSRALIGVAISDYLSDSSLREAFVVSLRSRVMT